MSYRRTKAAVVLRTNQKAERITEKNKKVAGQAKEKTPRTGQDKPAPRALQHFVKVRGLKAGHGILTLGMTQYYNFFILFSRYILFIIEY